MTNEVHARERGEREAVRVSQEVIDLFSGCQGEDEADRTHGRSDLLHFLLSRQGDLPDICKGRPGAGCDIPVDGSE